MTPNSIIYSRYARRHPLMLRWLTFLVIGFMCSGGILAYIILSPLQSKKLKGNRMYSRVFYLSPKLHNSKPKTENLNLNEYTVNVQHPIDNRSGATVDNFNRRPMMDEIQSKIDCDVSYFGGSHNGFSKRKNLTITTTVEGYYPYVKGYLWGKCNTDVKLDIKATLNDSTLVYKEYQSAYASSGLDKEYEGSVITTIEQGANVTLGVSLRKALDQFYSDLAKALPSTNLKNVLFPVGSAELTEESEADLKSVVDFMKNHRKTKIELDGYTDTLGDFTKDEELSLERAKEVKKYLVHHGIKSRRIKTKAFGPTKPISTNHSEDARKLNRRVELVIL